MDDLRHSNENTSDEPIRPALGELSFFAVGAEIASGETKFDDAFLSSPYRQRLRLSRIALRQNYLVTARAAREGAVITPAAEWLLDNHHIVDENFRLLEEGMSGKFIRSLPHTNTQSGAVPDVVPLVWRYVALSNAEVDQASFTALVEGFQSIRDLKIGELWALPSMLRYVLLENLRRVSDRVAQSRNERAEANRLADHILRDDQNPKSWERDRAVSDTMAAQLLYRLRDGASAADRGLAWLDRQLAARGTDSAQIILAEHARQSAANVIAGNVIRSLKTLGDINWADWFETVSRVDRLLRQDADFARLDRSTRNDYRNTVERIASRSDFSELDVARKALELADDQGPGLLLTGARVPDLEAACGYRAGVGVRFLRAWRKLGWMGIFGPALALTVLIGLLMANAVPGTLPKAAIWLLFLPALLSASEAAMGIVHLVAAWLAPPRRLPAFDYSDGIPAEARTLVVIPGLIDNFDAVDDLAETLELHYLANPDGAVDFALLTDWVDSTAEISATDRKVLAYAQSAIDRLAAKYAHVGRRFYLLHRSRLWNPGQGVWMGWERKRGKLSELNALLLGSAETTFMETGPRPPEGVRYVITLDSDTRLPRGTVAALVGKMMHPANRPVADPETGIVRSGHAIIQPRITASLTTANEASIFQRIFSVGRGMDPYVFTVSDLYQDLLDEGSFAGKGIYDVAAFEAAMAGRFPENLVLSHDLLEGSLARAALASDVQVVEDFPIRYDIDAARQHRWVRGDWQLLPYILDLRNGVPALGRLKMVDNLRRSLVAPSWIAASVAGWVVLAAGPALHWQALLLVTLFFMPIMNLQSGLVPRHPGVSALRHLGRVGADLAGHLAETGLRVVFIAHQAVSMVDAILRTLWRVYVSRRNLLEWRTAQEVHTRASGDWQAWWDRMILSPTIGVAALGLTLWANPGNLPLAAVFSLAWVAAPAVAQWVSRPLETADRLDLAPADRDTLRRVARTTWRFFETFVTEQTNHLPPDNFQDTPEPKLAERTSPTNVGLYLLAVLTARDMGWTGLRPAIARIERTLDAMDQLERFRGHFYNWYDTRDMRVLEPRYISSVDSGNLAGHLIVVSSALREWAANPAVHQYGSMEGIGDTLAALTGALAATPNDRRILRPLRRRLDALIEGFASSHRNYIREPQLAPVRALNLVVIAADIVRLADDLHAEAARAETAEVQWWAKALQRNCEELIGDVEASSEPLPELSRRVSRLAERARRIAFEMDFRLLMNPEKRLLSIGYRVSAQELDESCYDLLASEARLASLFAIAKGDLPTEHWMRLGRPVTTIGTQAALLSWSGSMFEYLMPPLVMHERTGGILDASNRMAVARQIQDGRRLGRPWGVSESAFNARDREMNYQYHAFGSPELALKRMFEDEYVVAPYATLLAAQVQPSQAVTNLRKLDGLGAFGPYGYYDAVDFTAARLPEGQRHAVVRNVMAHHHGMSIAAIGNAVLDGIHRRRFHDDEVIRAAELLLQEKAPREVVPVTRAEGQECLARDTAYDDMSLGTSTDPATDRRILALLSNGTLSAHLASTGSGSLRLGEIAITRWRPDTAVDHGGTFLFLRDVADGRWWSATTSPRRAAGETARAVFSDHKAEFFKTVGDIETRMDVIVASDATAEGRRLTITNSGTEPRTIEVTSYGEIVLDREDADQAHTAFSRMFVRTEIRDGGSIITARRRPRGAGGRTLYMAHLLAGRADHRSDQAETDRRKFLGRGRDLAHAAAFDEGASLTGTDGFTLDPVFSIRRKLTIPSGKHAALTFWTIASESEEQLDQVIRHFRNEAAFEHEARMAWTMSQVQLRHAGTKPSEAALFRTVAAALIWPDRRLGVQDDDLRASLGPQSDLWPMGISGDRPILLLRTDDEADMPILRKALRMAEYFRLHGLTADLVILNDRKSSYAEDLQTGIQAMVDLAARASHVDAAHRHVHVVKREGLSDASYQTLLAAARIVLHTRNGKISEQLARLEPAERAPEPVFRLLPAPSRSTPRVAPRFPDEAFLFWNGLGGFSQDGREYVVRMRHEERTPHPWINVIARSDFGFHVSAGGAAYTWSVNSRDHQLTPWSNDPVTNRPGEAILIRNVDTGAVISPFAALSDDPIALHEARHGLGYSRFRVWTDWVEAEALMTLADGAPARLTQIKVCNRGSAPLRLEVVSFAELVLGNNRARTAPMIRVTHDAERNALIARNPFSTDFAGRCTVLSANRPLSRTCTSRLDFLGRGGRLAAPEALAHWPEASGTEGDPCLAARTDISVAAGGEETVTFILSDSDTKDMNVVLQNALDPDAVNQAKAAAEAEWVDFLGCLQVSTPDPAFDLMINTWLPYQSLACRIRGRTAFYQASGAYGFRDQLQDTSAWILQDPALARAQLLTAASRQFTEGDVQHWWLPGSGAGVRTMISDDPVWLAHLTARYVGATGDKAVLDDMVPFLTGPALEPGQHDAFFVPTLSGTEAPLWDHCALALDLVIKRTGANGMPLFLTGDWNDGMNRVGEEGRGESVWLAWFLLDTLDAMIPLAKARKDTAHVSAWRLHRKALVDGIETAGWDGEWYRRGFYDDGTPLGSKDSAECRIDSIAQSWATISGAGDADRASRALDSVMAHLADDEAGIVRLFTPPFDKTEKEPGYIKAYPPGVRENGGQYTHAATWLAYALGRAGRGTDALRVFGMLNPVNHATTRDTADRYRVEPYVVAADIYGAGDKTGRGGWTWYTGSAGWLYRAGVEGILGLSLEEGDRLRVKPALPDGWTGFTASLQRNGTRIAIEVRRRGDGVAVLVDGIEADDGVVWLDARQAREREPG
ncbi:GH36-type glycosyl hydrolase domain-containing protein [Seohaeicola nanhaiensis]|uniref:GH36-type glycosyl hydrolase domain-containing protein n=1 Tax=Seohaeicola nanhaiensis TaxID=1387282 RepID=A0ABV9KLJ4_9RHOB